MSSRTTRRAVLKTVCGGVAAHAMVGQVSGRKRQQPLEQQLQQIEDATKRYSNPDHALDDGYRIMGPYVPAMGWHFVNPEYSEQAAKNGPALEQPPMLTYNLGMELGSVEYAVPLEQTMDGSGTPQPLDLFNDETADRDVTVVEAEGWHPHYEAQHVFSNGNGKFDDESPSMRALVDLANWVELSDHNDQLPDARHGLEAGETLEVAWEHDADPEVRVVDKVATHPSLQTLHVWVHFENPHGVFAGFNPAFDPFDAPGDDHDHEH